MPHGNPGVSAPSTPSPHSSGTVELKALTGVRFFAAIFVVIYHYCRLPLKDAPQFLQNITATGYICVDFFFLLSGFVLAYSNITGSGERRTTPAAFWAARIGRIYPAYFAAFLIVTPFNIVGTMHANAFKIGIAKLVTGAALVLAMVQSWSPWSAWYWNFPAWSLSVEMFFYFMFPFLTPWAARLNRRACLRLLPFVWLIGLLVPAAFVGLHRYSAEPPYSNLQLAVEVTPILRLPEFICGVLLGRFYSLDGQRNRGIGGLMALAGVAGLVAVLSFSDQIPRPLLANGIVAPLFAIIIFGLAQGRGMLAALLSTPFLVLLGEASYGIYILQYPVACVFGVSDTVYTPVRTALYVVGLIAVSILCFLYFESPLRGRIRRLLSGPLESLVSRANAFRTNRRALRTAI